MIPFITINLDKPRRLRFGMGAMVEFEQLTGLKITALDDEMGMETLSKLLWVSLKQEDKDLTLQKTCEIIDDYADSMTDVMEAVTNALKAAFPDKSPNVEPPKN